MTRLLSRTCGWACCVRGWRARRIKLELADGRNVQFEAPPLETENLERDTLRPLGIVRFDPVIEPVIGKLLPDGAAARAGFQAGDRLLTANGVKRCELAGLGAAGSPASGQVLAYRISSVRGSASS